MYTFTAKNCHSGETCGHNHRSFEAAEPCKRRLNRQPHVPGAVIRIVRYHGTDSDGERGTQTNFQPCR